jgi:hypothetical protein
MKQQIKSSVVGLAMTKHNIMCCFAICILLLISAPAASNVLLPPNLQPGWNMISTPCDIEVADLKDILQEPDISVFSWDGDNYVPVESLKRGYGYVLTSTSPLDLLESCADVVPQNEISVTLNQGWNLVGNPFVKETTFDVLFGNYSALIDSPVFFYSQGEIEALDRKQVISPWRGYWVYLAHEQIVDLHSLPTRCESVRMELPNGRIINKNDSILVNVECDYQSVSYEITDSCQWMTVRNSKEKNIASPSFLTAEASNGYVELICRYFDISATANLFIDYDADQIESVNLHIDEAEMLIGQESNVTVLVKYDDGFSMERTADASFVSSDESIGFVSEGTIKTQAHGDFEVVASFKGVESFPVKISVIEDDVLEVNVTAQRNNIEIHEVTWVSAKYKTTMGRTGDITDKVQWHVEPQDIVTLTETTGIVHPNHEGTAIIYATYNGVRSIDIPITVGPKTLWWIEPLRFYELPCPDKSSYDMCYTNHAMHVGEERRFDSLGIGDTTIAFTNGQTGYASEYTFKWEVTDPSVLSVTSSGTVTGLKEGISGIRIYRDGVYSEWSWVYVYSDSTQQFLMLETTGMPSVVKANQGIPIGATRYSLEQSQDRIDRFTAEEVTRTATWIVSDPAIGEIRDGMFWGKAPGETQIIAKYDGNVSNGVKIRVWAPQQMSYCDANDINEALWSDGISLASLETDCHEYSQQSTVSIRYLAEVQSEHRWKATDVCLDLYIYDSGNNLVRTFQHNNCSPTPLFRRHEGYTPVYDYGALWDQKDDNGNAVPPGEYTAVARFYILYCPVMKLKFTVK